MEAHVETKRFVRMGCSGDAGEAQEIFRDLPQVVQEMVAGFADGRWTSHIEPVPIPSRKEVVALIHGLQQILFPGYFTGRVLSPESVEYHLGQAMSQFAENLYLQVNAAIRHDCFRHNQACSQCSERATGITRGFLASLPHLREMLEEDLQAALQGDPAAANVDEVIFSYPGFFAVMVHRAAHRLLELGAPLLPRILAEFAYHRTAIDIHPAATVGRFFFIDHGAGVVIGATCEIGDRVRLYQGVTLGALSLPRDAGPRLRAVKRHPTIEDDVIIYANATVLGGETVIGARSVIGGNVWLTHSVPPRTKVLIAKHELVFLQPGKRRARQQLSAAAGECPARQRRKRRPSLNFKRR